MIKKGILLSYIFIGIAALLVMFDLFNTLFPSEPNTDCGITAIGAIGYLMFFIGIWIYLTVN